MIYITTDPVTNAVQSIHYMPFDEVNGLGKTEDELKATGYITDSTVPQPEQLTGKQPNLYYTEAAGFTYQYTDRTLTDSEKLIVLQSQLTDAQAQNAQILFALVNGGLM